MERVQYYRLISIFGAMLAGIWIPLRLVGYHIPYNLELTFDFTISVISCLNISMYFQATHRSIKSWKSWLSLSLMMDIACVFPMSYIETEFFNSEHRVLLLINFLAVRHLKKIKAFMDQFDSLAPLYYRLIPLGCMMPILVHFVACSWIALGSGTAGPDADKVLEYVKAIYWSITTLSTVGYGDISAKTPMQMLFACFTQLIGVGIFGYVLSNVASLLSRSDAAREHHMDNLDRVETFMGVHRIPVHLRNKIRAYYHYLWMNRKGYQDGSLLQDLPHKIQSELFFHINQSIIEKVPFLKGASTELLEDLMNELEPRIYVPSEKIFRIDEVGTALYFIHSGQVEISARDGSLITTLGDGAFFGEMALLSDRPRNATAKAVSFCDIYVLPRESFFNVLTSYPEFGTHIQDVIKARTAA